MITSKLSIGWFLLRIAIQNLNKEGRERLVAAFDVVNGHFKELFTTLFGGGSAELQLVESDDPLEAGAAVHDQIAERIRIDTVAMPLTRAGGRNRSGEHTGCTHQQRDRGRAYQTSPWH